MQQKGRPQKKTTKKRATIENGKIQKYCGEKADKTMRQISINNKRHKKGKKFSLLF